MRHWRALPRNAPPKTDNAKTRILKPNTGDDTCNHYKNICAHIPALSQSKFAAARPTAPTNLKARSANATPFVTNWKPFSGLKT